MGIMKTKSTYNAVDKDYQGMSTFATGVWERALIAIDHCFFTRLMIRIKAEDLV
jgi:hypothetical protein